MYDQKTSSSCSRWAEADVMWLSVFVFLDETHVAARRHFFQLEIVVNSECILFWLDKHFLQDSKATDD